jgi:hypothetical protein
MIPPALPASSFEVVVEPSQEDLVRGQLEQIFNSLSFLAQPVKLRMELDVDLGEQTSPDDLPNETKDEMFPTFCEIRCANVDDRATDTFRRGDDDVVVLGYLEGVQRLLGRGFVEDTRINGVGYGVVDQLAQNQAVLAFVEDLHGIGRDWEAARNIGVVLNDLF